MSASRTFCPCLLFDLGFCSILSWFLRRLNAHCQFRQRYCDNWHHIRSYKGDMMAQWSGRPQTWGWAVRFPVSAGYMSQCRDTNSLTLGTSQGAARPQRIISKGMNKVSIIIISFFSLYYNSKYTITGVNSESTTTSTVFSQVCTFLSMNPLYTVCSSWCDSNLFWNPGKSQQRNLRLPNYDKKHFSL